MRIKHLLCMAILAATMMACGLPSTQQPSSTASWPVPSASPTSTAAVTPTRTPTRASIATPMMTFTPTPTRASTATPTLTSTPTPVVVPTVNPLPTPVALPGMPQPGATLTRPMNKDEMVMHYVPAGPFYMGSPEGVGEGNEHPQHVVTLNAFWIDETEVTPWHYQTCVGAGVCDTPPMDDYALSGKPVVVTWSEAQTYCRWIGGRLPTEAEWEKAARGTDGRTYPWGEEQPDCSRANHQSLKGACSEGPVDAGAYPDGASPYGVLDMAGNVAEWVNDWYDPGYYVSSPEQNPQGPGSGQTRVARGGSWDDTSSAIRAAYRVAYAPDDVAIGFRCVVPAAAYTVVESDLYDGWHQYTNLDYGFSFHYPPDWTLEERLHQLVFRHKLVDTLQFSIVYRRATEDIWVSRTGMPAGDFVPKGSVRSQGREISRNVLVYEGKDKLVSYNFGDAASWGGLVLGCTLEDWRSDYEALDLPEDVQRQIDQVVASLELLNSIATLRSYQASDHGIYRSQPRFQVFILNPVRTCIVGNDFASGSVCRGPNCGDCDMTSCSTPM